MNREDLMAELENLRRRVAELEEIHLDFSASGRAFQETVEPSPQFGANIPLAYQSLDADGNFIAVNPIWLDTLGYSHDEVIGKWCGDFLTVPYREKFVIYFAEFKRIGEIHGVEFEMVRKDGSVVFIKAEGKIEHDCMGRFKQTHCILENVTEIKREEEKLRDTEREFRTLLDNIPDCIVRFDQKLRHVYVNPAISRTFGIRSETFLGKTLEELAGPADIAQNKALTSMLELALAQGTTNQVEAKWDTKEGLRTFHILHVPERDEVGQVVGVVGIARDITEHKQAEERLRLMDFALEHVREAAFLIDEHGRFGFVNEESCRMLDYTLDEMLGLSVSDVDPDFSVKSRMNHWTDLEKQGSLTFESRFKARDGRIFPVEINANYFDYGGQGYNLVLARDITERKKAEREHRENLRFFERLDRINRAIQGTNDIERMMSDVLDVVLSIYDCDRAFLLYPCDPGAGSWTVPMEKTKPEYPGLHSLGIEIPTDEEVEVTFSILSATDGPAQFGPGTPHPLPTEISERFGFKSLMSMAIRPKIGNAWQFGIHQCACRRVWTLDEERLFKEIGLRLEDGLSTLLTYRNLRDSMTKLEEVQRIGHIGYWDRDVAGGRITLADEACRIFGISPEDTAVGLEKWHELWLSLVHPEDTPRVNRAYFEALGNGPGYNVEYRIIRHDGEIRHIHSEANITRDASGNVIRMLGMMQDITERKRGEEALNRANKKWEHTFDAIPDMVMVLDNRYRILRANKAMTDLLKRSENELKGKFCYEIVHDRNNPPPFCPHAVLLRDGRDHSVELFEPKLGRSLDVRVSPLSDETGAVMGSVHVVRDVTEQKNLQKQLFQAQKMESIGTLAGGIAHDFNNLMQIVLGYSEMLLFRTEPSDSKGEGLRAIRKAARDASELTKRILAFSRKLEPDSRPVNLNNEIIRIEKMLHRTVPRMIRIELRLAENLMTVSADPGQMEQILLNLVVNAQHAMPDGGLLTIETANVVLDHDFSRAHVDVSPGNYVLMSVSDTGHGIDKEVMEHIFEPFYTTKEPGVGTGLGLSMVFGIVKGHGGHISCRSELGSGTVFEIYLPVIAQEMEDDVATSMQMPAFGTETILVVDDEQSVRKLAEQMLRHAGYNVMTACNGKEALEIYRSNPDRIALVILDLMMPEMGGRSCLQEILKISPKARVLIASGYSVDQSTRNGLEEGAVGFIAKPFAVGELLQTTRKILDLQAS